MPSASHDTDPAATAATTAHAGTGPAAITATSPATDAATAPTPTRLRPRTLVVLCALVVVAATAVRTWVAAAGWFYWDDLILHGRAAAHALPNPGFLLSDHDGHLMPGGMALIWLATRVAPLEFWLPLVQITLLQLIAGAAVARMLWVLLRGRPILLVPLVATLAIPLGLPAATWWAAALNSLPLTAAMAWAVTSMVLLARTGRNRHAVGAALATLTGLLFVEKAVLIPVVAAAVLAGLWWTNSGGRDDRARESPRTLWQRTRRAWFAHAAIVAVWAVVFVVVVGRLGGRGAFGDTEGERPGPLTLVLHAYRLAVVPTLGGGPWRWGRWHPGPPMADPPVAAVLVGLVACGAVLAWSLLTRRRTGPIWVAVALYPLVSVVLVVAGRAGPDTAPEIVQTLRYHPEFPVVLAAAAALALAAPPRTPAPATPRAVRIATTVGLVALLASSAVSTVTYRQVWAEQPSRDYAEPLLAALRERSAAMLDQDVPLEVLHPVTAPAHRLSTLLTGVPDVPEVGRWTPEPVLIDARGTLHPAAVLGGRSIVEGPEPGCGHRVGPEGATLALDGPLLERDWVVQLNVFADVDGRVAVRLDGDEETLAPVAAGLGTVFVRVNGGGTTVTVEPRGGVSELCIGSGPVGVLVPR